MTPVGINNNSGTQTVAQSQAVQPLNSEKESTVSTTSASTEKLVTLSDEGLAKQAADKAGQQAKGEEKGLTDKVESFAYGTLGLDHPDEIEKQTDDSYTAGQYLKGALTVGGLLLAIV